MKIIKGGRKMSLLAGSTFKLHARPQARMEQRSFIENFFETCTLLLQLVVCISLSSPISIISFLIYIYVHINIY